MANVLLKRYNGSVWEEFLPTPAAHTQAWSTITSTPTTIAGYGITNAFDDSSTYRRLRDKAGAVSDWVSTTQNGLIPYASGGSGSLGTSGWPFSTIYGNTVYEGGTALSSKYLGISAKAADADKLDGNDSAYFQPASTAITTSNIGSQSVNYATSAGSATNATNATNAGNADTLDGQHGSYYQPASTAITTSNIGSQSVSYATTAGTAGMIDYFGSTSTAMTTAAKTATLTPFSLTTGAVYSITFSNGSYVASPTININSSGAKTIRVNNATATATSFNLNPGDTAIMVYDGTYMNVMSITKAQTEPMNYIGAASAGQNTAMSVAYGANVRGFVIQMLQDSSTSSYTIGQLNLTLDDTYSLGATTRYYRMAWFNGSGSQNLTFQYYVSGNTLYMQHNFAFTMGVRVYALGG